jgi:hypothetical protein
MTCNVAEDTKVILELLCGYELSHQEDAVRLHDLAVASEPLSPNMRRGLTIVLDMTNAHQLAAG